MKIYLDVNTSVDNASGNELILELSETKKKVLCDCIFKDDLKEDIKRRLIHAITHKYESCLKRLKDQWLVKLKENGVKSIPLDDEELAELIFSQKEYKDRGSREKKMPDKIGLDYLDQIVQKSG